MWSIVYLIQGFAEPPADKRNAPHFFCMTISDPLEQGLLCTITMESSNCRSTKKEKIGIEKIRILSYHLNELYPTKLSAQEIAKHINLRFNQRLSRWQVQNALRSFARLNKHFAIFPSFFPTRIKYSIYKLEPPFNSNQ